ncbi:MAG: anaerobic sulfatase maturase [Planctomycetota bacterium]
MRSSSKQNCSPKGFNIIAKPTGPACNLDCRYCFYTEKESLFPKNHTYRMNDEVLETFIRKYIESQPLPEVPFVWQGGEPALMGLDFYREAIRLQKKYAGGRQISNSLQTNGTLLDENWCEFMAGNNFLVGLSIDGPEDIHNYYRVDHSGGPTFEAVIRGLELLKKHGVEFNVLACVTRQNVTRPLDTYRFFKEQGVRFIQFIPIVERQPDRAAEGLGLRLAAPAAAEQEDTSEQVTEWSVEPAAYGDFLIKIFNEWVRTDVGRVFVMNFEWALASWVNGITPACTFSESCGRCLVMEHNGDVYSCDHYVYPEHCLGNIMNDELGEMVESEKQIQFGRSKETAISTRCRKCDVLFACHGDCPKHRFMKLREGQPGVSYLCESYKRFFKHIAPYMKKIRQLIRQGRPAEMIMELQGKMEPEDASR